MYRASNWLILVELPVRFFFIPLSYLYFKNYTQPNYKPNRKVSIILFLPGVLDVLFYFTVHIWSYFNVHTKEEQMILLQKSYSLIFYRTYPAFVFNVLIYGLLFFEVRTLFRSIKAKSLTIIPAQRRYVVVYMIGHAFLLLVWAGFLFKESFGVMTIVDYLPLYAALGIITVFFGYWIVVTPNLYTYFEVLETEIQSLQQEYTPLPLDANNIIFKTNNEAPEEQYTEQPFVTEFLRLKTYMESEKPYLNQGVTLKDISGHLQIPAHILTKSIQYFTGKNYYTFIYSFRISYWVTLLAESDSNLYTLDSLAKKSGINSKSTLSKYCVIFFNATPGEVLEKVKSKKITAEMLGTLHFNR